MINDENIMMQEHQPLRKTIFPGSQGGNEISFKCNLYTLGTMGFNVIKCVLILEESKLLGIWWANTFWPYGPL